MDEATFFRRVLSIVESEFSDIRWSLCVDDGLLIDDEGIEYGLRNLLTSVELAAKNGESLDECVVEHFRRVINAMRFDLDSLSADVAISSLYPLLSLPERTPKLDLFEVLADGLRKCLVVDLQNSFRYVGADRLAAWGLSPVEAFRIAAQNLAGKSRDIPTAIMEDWPGKPLLIGNGDGYDATRITVPEFRQQIADQLGETFWVAMPTRVHLLACRANISKRTQRQLQERVSSAFEELPYPLSPQIFWADVNTFPSTPPKQTSWWQRISR